ncbi:serine/threonine-protein kinase STY17-like [Dendronephthya gigantea]|uniref:serine/threonine-protein kinase STY17-like n=1 Tax=Dendronephthya gigantea TaxID=151771 RepID=UPI00106DAA2A|nr:serine/threonine-protein kinase STY17-like [Dendronephthya gigantea]
MYDPIQKKSLEIIYEILPWGIKLCPATINASDLDWKKDHRSCVGEGEVSTVYKGKLKNLGRNKSETSEMNVAVKVFKKQFDEPNSRYFLQEELQIRDLRHKNVLKYFGAARTSDNTLLSNDHQFIFVMEAARQNLRSVIFKNRILTPAESENSKLAIGKFIKRAMDIADGLNYIHERGLIHRHLKLENILEDEDGTAMISDIGIVGQFLETEKSITNLAPEVLEDLRNRTKAADVYSYGIVLWEMWYGAHAFREFMPIEKVQFREKLVEGYRPEMDNNKSTYQKYMGSWWQAGLLRLKRDGQ